MSHPLPDHVRCLEVRRDDLAATRVVDDPAPVLRQGQALLRVERFGLTANNVTYAVTGDTIGYWRFFPAAQGWGRVPAWGFAEVVAGDVDGLETGTRVFGYLPMSTHLLVEPTKVSERGFTDGAAHRAELPAPYNSYRRVDADPLYSPDAENLQTLLLPLYMTSFVLEDYLVDNEWFTAEQVVMSSGSAKTTIGTAMLASRRVSRPTIIALTSPHNADLVASLGCYDDVVTYDELGTLDAERPTTYVDVAGDAGLRARVHELFADTLRHSCAVGMSHWDAPHRAAVTGPRPTFFFAPAQIGKRVGDWGGEEYQKKLTEAWTFLRDATAPWLDVHERTGIEDAEDAYHRLLAGQVGGREAAVIRP